MPDHILESAVLRPARARGPQIERGPGVGWDAARLHPQPGGRALAMGQGLLAEPEDMDGLWIKAANNLTAGGGRPEIGMLSLCLARDVEGRSLGRWMCRAAEAARRLGMELAGGDTKVAGRGMALAPGHIFASLLVMGDALPAPARRPRAGDALLVCGTVGLEGAGILACRRRRELEGAFGAFFVEEMADAANRTSTADMALAAWEAGALAMHDGSWGGILAALWELGEALGLGFSADMASIPIRQAEVELCEFFHINPYKLLSGGCLLMCAEDGEALMASMRAKGYAAAVIGRLEEGRSRRLSMVGAKAGEAAALERPGEDALYKALPC